MVPSQDALIITKKHKLVRHILYYKLVKSLGYNNGEFISLLVAKTDMKLPILPTSIRERRLYG